MDDANERLDDGAELTQPELHTARSMLERGLLDAAIELLSGLEESAAGQALLGAAYFRKEQYAQAAEHLARAVNRGAGERTADLLAKAQANEHTDVARRVPERYDFDQAALLSGPQPGPHEVAEAPEWEEPDPALKRAATLIGMFAGDVSGRALGLLSQAFGEPVDERPWTTWYKHDFPRAMLMLANRRHRLNREQLFSAYPKGTLVGFGEPGQRPPDWALRARTPDGSWNDLDDPMAGAAHARFGFNTEPSHTPPEDDKRLLEPNPRRVSRVLMTRKDGFKPVPFLNLLAASWIQYMNHDWVSYGDPSDTHFYEIPLDPDDPVRRVLQMTHMRVGKTQKDPTARKGDPGQTHVNEVSSWWDGSQIYGSDARTLASVRSHVHGKLALDPVTGNLPIAADGVESTGFRRNWWVGLSMLHTLFTREHNSICDMLRAKYPDFSDQRLFDTARLINAAGMAKIHTVEWTPAILPNKVLNAAMNYNWYGLLTNLLRGKEARKAHQTIKVTDPIAGGIIGNQTNNHGVAYALSREFLSVYRLHSLLPDELDVRSLDGSREPRTIPLARTRQRGSHLLTAETSMTDLFYSFGMQHPGQLVLNNYPRTLQELTIPQAGFYDMAAVDVLRDRERGVPRYNAFRRLFGLKPIGRFEDLTDDAEQIAALKEVYADIEDIDLLVGNLAEGHRPEGFGFGETLFQVFILNASRRLEADRFFSSDYRPEVYTPEGLQWVDKVTFKQVLLRHHPELLASGLANVENAFEPWDIGVLDPARHPLRELDPELKSQDAHHLKARTC